MKNYEYDENNELHETISSLEDQIDTLNEKIKDYENDLKEKDNNHEDQLHENDIVQDHILSELSSELSKEYDKCYHELTRLIDERLDKQTNTMKFYYMLDDMFDQSFKFFISYKKRIFMDNAESKADTLLLNLHDECLQSTMFLLSNYMERRGDKQRLIEDLIKESNILKNFKNTRTLYMFFTMFKNGWFQRYDHYKNDIEQKFHFLKMIKKQTMLYKLKAKRANNTDAEKNEIQSFLLNMRLINGFNKNPIYDIILLGFLELDVIKLIQSYDILYYHNLDGLSKKLLDEDYLKLIEKHNKDLYQRITKYL